MKSNGNNHFPFALVEMAGGQRAWLKEGEPLHNAFEPDITGYEFEDPATKVRLKVRPKKEKRVGYDRPHVVLFIDSFPEIIDSLSGQEVRVLARIIASVGYGENFVPVCGAQIARKLGIRPSRVSEALSKLRKLGILIRSEEKDGNLSRYRISPELCWRGNAYTYQRAMRAMARDGPAK